MEPPYLGFFAILSTWVYRAIAFTVHGIPIPRPIVMQKARGTVLRGMIRGGNGFKPGMLHNTGSSRLLLYVKRVVEIDSGYECLRPFSVRKKRELAMLGYCTV